MKRGKDAPHLQLPPTLQEVQRLQEMQTEVDGWVVALELESLATVANTELGIGGRAVE